MTHAGPHCDEIHTIIEVWTVAIISKPPVAIAAIIRIRIFSAIVASDGIAALISVGVIFLIGGVAVARDRVSSAASPVVHSNAAIQVAVQTMVRFVDGSQSRACASVGQ